MRGSCQATAEMPSLFTRNLRLLLSLLSRACLYYLFLVMTAQNIHSPLQMPMLTYSL